MKFRVAFTAPVTRDLYFSDCDGRDFVMQEVAREGLMAYEHPVPSLVVSCLSHDPGTFVDIGANTGLYTLLAVGVSDQVSAVAFEPLDKAFEVLTENIALNEGFEDRITAVPLALSNQIGTLTFFETVNAYGFLSTSSTLDKTHADFIFQSEKGEPYVERTVDATTLDAWTRDNSVEKIVAMKLDAEGHEAGVLEGASATIEQHRPFLFLEILGNADFEALNSFIRDNNYFDIRLQPKTLQQFDQVDFDVASRNQVLCPMEKAFQFLTAASAVGVVVG